MRITTITPMRDEGPFILEWVAYHRLIGFNDMIVFSNDCIDGSDDLLDRLDELGYLRHLPNPCMIDGNASPHWTVLKYANLMGRLKKSDWFLSFDADEFVCINEGEGTLEDLFHKFPDADAISMNQLAFGCSGIEHYSPELQMNQFDRCDEKILTEKSANKTRGVKTLHKNSVPFDRFSNHSSVYSKDKKVTMNWISGSGEKITPEINSKEVLKHTEYPLPDHTAVQLNHYVIRSMESYLVQVARGNATNNKVVSDERYWRRNNRNYVKDISIQRFSDRVSMEIKRMLEDKKLFELHYACIENHKKLIEQLKELEGFNDLYKKIKRQHRKNWPNLASSGAV